MKKRCNFLLDESLLERIDKESALMHMNRTQYVIRACEQMAQCDAFLRENQNIKDKMVELTNAINAVAIESK